MIAYLFLLLSLAPSLSYGVSFDPFTDKTEITHHGGPILTREVNLMLIFYGDDREDGQKNLIRNFIKSLNEDRGATKEKGLPQVSTWWKMVEAYQAAVPGANAGKPPVIKVIADKQKITSPKYGKVLTAQEIIPNLIKDVTQGDNKVIPVIVAAKDVTVQGLCAGKCADKGIVDDNAYIVVGNPETECPGACGWPFNEADSGPKGPILKPPNQNMPGDAMVVAFAGALVDTILSPHNTGFFGGNEFEPYGPATVCRGIFGEGASPGNPGKVLTDPKTGGNYNAVGNEGKEFLVPAIWNPKTKSCWTPMMKGGTDD
ncbi:Tho complex subunit 7/Mft1p [Hibiscus syriacus]|uniref:Tho complex subunit 7/Mft1p n=1 Tax=Hibiscus syriacus TaxID=106335 RepID=A0A6A3B258_HIBSY|nr:protein EXORDIUM-like 4 [Hibiscus syriacus]KAE8709968.1 Tho complex subunit 7/Mft1p [Hibiscus syriacus]